MSWQNIYFLLLKRRFCFTVKSIFSYLIPRFPLMYLLSLKMSGFFLYGSKQGWQHEGLGQHFVCELFRTRLLLLRMWFFYYTYRSDGNYLRGHVSFSCQKPISCPSCFVTFAQQLENNNFPILFGNGFVLVYRRSLQNTRSKLPITLLNFHFQSHIYHTEKNAHTLQNSPWNWALAEAESLSSILKPSN